MNTEQKVNEVTDINKIGGMLNAYSDLISMVLGNPRMHSELSHGVEFQGVPDKDFTVRAYDKTAVGIATDGTVAVTVKYPSKFDLTKEQLMECLDYRGIKYLSNTHITYYRAITSITDVMMKFGEVTYVHLIK